MHSMIELHPRPDALDGLGLPAIPYPVALPAFQAAVANDGELPLADMLHGLQSRAARPDADWQRMEPAMARLAELLAPDDRRETMTVEGADWWLEIGPVDLGRAVVTLQRADMLLAAVAPRDDGRLRMAAYRPLDGRAITLLRALACKQPSLAGSRGRAANWERLQDAAANAVQADARESGLSHLYRWDSGWGKDPDGRELPGWGPLPDVAPRRPACVVAELGTFHTLDDAAG